MLAAYSARLRGAARIYVIDAVAERLEKAGELGAIPVNFSLREGRLLVPWSRCFNKNASIKMGRDDDERWNRKLRDMIVSAAAKPSQIVSHRLSLNEAAAAFAKFDAREEGYIKVVLKIA